MVGHNIDSEDMELLNLDGETAAPESEAAPEEPVEEVAVAIEVPVENLGAGIVNALGDMVGGMIGLSNSAVGAVQSGVQTVKEKVADFGADKDETSGDDETVSEIAIDQGADSSNQS